MATDACRAVALARSLLFVIVMRAVICLILFAASITACVAGPDDVATELSAGSGKADGEAPVLTIMQGHVPEKVAIQCEYADPSTARDCDITFTLTPTAYTKKLMTKKLAGKTAADLPLPVLHEVLVGEPFGTLDVVADLRPDDGSGAPVVAALADGTPIVFSGASLHVVQGAQTESLLRLQMDVAFWYNAVDFAYGAVFAGTAPMQQ